jgi:glycine/D-amino acid oxidase-like deaminating enzyme/nitrite reductase/ring-hydroxylating ferredoxin subunit
MKDIGILEPYWLASTPKTDFPSLNEDLKTDITIIGGGMVGILSAYLLKKEGFKVAIVEADRILQGTTAHTTAKLTSQHGLIYDKIKRAFSTEKASLYAEANEYAINFIENIVKENSIDCDFTRLPAYVYTQEDSYIENIENEVKVASELGLNASFLKDISLPFEVKAAERFEDQAMFHPRKFLLSLAKEIHSDGSYIFENTRAAEINKGTHPEVITSNNKKITSDNIIIATQFPFYDGLGLYFTRLFPERSYVLGVKIKDPFPKGVYITAEEPGRSLRSQPFEDGELVLIGGEHHKTGHGTNYNNYYTNLKNFAENTYTLEKVLYRWSAQDYGTLDGLPYVGRLTSKTPNIYVATGFNKWGMTNSTVSAIMIKDLILKGENPWTSVYDPSRFITSSDAMSTFIKQNADVAKNYVKDKLKPIPEEIEIKNGDAKIVNVDGQRIGAYRDDNGVLHKVDTTCTHLGCELHWNDAERSWDCPCHGSRFTYEGKVINGPAHLPLNHLKEGPNKIDPNIL